MYKVLATYFENATFRLPFKAYKMLLHLHERNKRTWASSVCYVLYKYDFGDVWVNQGVGDEKAFLKEFKERILSLYRQEWDNSCLLYTSDAADDA